MNMQTRVVSRFASMTLAAAAVVLAAPAAYAQTTCAVTGEYVVSASLQSLPGPAPVTGTFTFTPAAGCQAGAVGSVLVDLNIASAAGLVPYQATLPYTVQGTVVSLGGAIPSLLGFGGAGACAKLARDTSRPAPTRVLLCAAVTVGVWGVFDALASLAASTGM